MKNQGLSFTNFLLVILHLFAKVTNYGRRQEEGETGIFPPCKLGLRTKISRKPEVCSYVSIKSFNCCSDSLFAGMTMTLHNTHRSCSSVRWLHRSTILTEFHGDWERLRDAFGALISNCCDFKLFQTNPEIVFSVFFGSSYCQQPLSKHQQ